MKTEVYGEVVLTDFEPTLEDFEGECIAGLRQHPKTLPCKFFYDKRGSQLFDQICELDEYYLTRTETHILREHIAEITALCGPCCSLVELGSGSSTKTRLLLNHLEAPVAYVPIDISRPHLLHAAATLQDDYSSLQLLPVCADYNHPLALPSPAITPERTIVFFPGSTIGNFQPWMAAAFLGRIANWCQPGDGLLLGVDLQKSPEILEPAYNDCKGVTAAFNLNLLRRANDELGANFVLKQFQHRAIYNAAQGRIEMQLVSRCRQAVTIGAEKIAFDKGEPITTEYSYKYSVGAFCELAASAGWEVKRTWTDPNRWFSVHFLTY